MSESVEGIIDEGESMDGVEFIDEGESMDGDEEGWHSARLSIVTQR